MPVLAPLAADLVRWLQPQAWQKTLDIGTGTGIVARLLAPHVNTSFGLDFVAGMLTHAQTIAHQKGLTNLYFFQADAHRLPLPTASLDLVTASLGFNATDPWDIFPEVHRTLKSGAEFAFQEWGGVHPLDEIIGEALRTYALDDDDAPAELVEMRDFLDEDSIWLDELQTVDDYKEMLSEAGFIHIEALEHAPITLKLTVQEFMTYKITWTARAAELNAMDTSSRADCLDRMRQNLYEKTDEHGLLSYNPSLFRIRATRP